MLKIELPYDPTIALQGIDPKDTDVEERRGTCTPMFIAAMSTTAKLWKEPKCLSTDEWIKKMWSKYTMECYSAIGEDEYPPFAPTWMELEGIMLRDKSSRETQLLYGFTHMWNIRNRVKNHGQRREN